MAQHKTTSALLSAAVNTDNKQLVGSENKNVYLGNPELEHIYFQRGNETVNFDHIRYLILNLGTFDDDIPLETHLKNMFLNTLPTDELCRGTFVWMGVRNFEAFIYGARNYGHIIVTAYDGRKITLVCDKNNFYFIDHNDSGYSIYVSENISSSVDIINDDTYINVKDSRVKQTDAISDIEVWDCVARGATTCSFLEAVIIYDGGFVLDVKNLSIIGHYLYRVRYRINRKQV